jgi:hypothetical protein
MIRVVLPPIIRSAYNCIYNIWYLSRRYCDLPLSWKSLDRFECAVGCVLHPQHTQTSCNSSTIAADSSNGVTNIRCCRYSCMCSWWWVEVPPETCRAVSRYKYTVWRSIFLDIHVYWNILTRHVPINVKSHNNISKRQMGFNSALKGLTSFETTD